jgi:hypothetical protein
VNINVVDTARLINIAGLGPISIADVPGKPGQVSVTSFTGTNGIHAGDVLELPGFSVVPPASPTIFRVVEVLDISRMRLHPSIATGGGVIRHLAAGIRLKNFSAVVTNTTGVLPAILNLNNCWEPEIEGLELDKVRIIGVQLRGGSIARSSLAGGSMSLVSLDRTTIAHNRVRGETELYSTAAGIGITNSRRLSVHGNRSFDHSLAIPDYRVVGSADILGWSDNQDSGKDNAYLLDDPGQTMSRDVTLRARNSVITKDLLAKRINQGAYDQKIAILAAELDTLKTQDILELAFGATIFFDTESLLV